jgi:aryl-alcohol dehydrogenase-like predicted oxidoreductase
MKYRTLGATGWQVSEVSFGAWAVGGTWGEVDDQESLRAMHQAVDIGVNFFDTADVYGDGRSERLISQLRAERTETIYVATKAGRRLNPHAAEGYTIENIEAFVDRSLQNLGVETIDLLQLHCPPTPVYYQPELFEGLGRLVQNGKLRHFGVSVEKVEEALKAIEYPGVVSVQIIYNVFRQRPAELFFREAKSRNIGVIARLPLSSGMLTGKMSPSSQFEESDHRAFNRNGEAFDKGETFSGIDYGAGLAAVEELRPLVPQGMTFAQFALKWILMNDAVTCAIPGAKRPDQAVQNAAASDLPELDAKVLAGVNSVYEGRIKPLAHHRW